MCLPCRHGDFLIFSLSSCENKSRGACRQYVAVSDPQRSAQSNLAFWAKLGAQRWDPTKGKHTAHTCTRMHTRTRAQLRMLGMAEVRACTRPGLQLLELSHREPRAYGGVQGSDQPREGLFLVWSPIKEASWPQGGWL